MGRPTTKAPSEAHTKQIYVTTDYDVFKYLKGNRHIDKNHVERLKRKIEEEGNLTSEYPVSVNDAMEVLDGQHRIEALKQLGYPVYYTISEGMGLSVVRQVNIGRKNWSWIDYAQSWTEEGNPHYKELLDFYAAFNFNNRILIHYCMGSLLDTDAYQKGEFKVLDRGHTFKLLTQLSEVREAFPYPITSACGDAFHKIMNHTDYDHARMLKQLTKYGSRLHEWRKLNDWLRDLEDLYNLNYPENSHVRFF